MKELSIEEKAKRYDEAKLRMSAAYNNNRCTIGFMNEIFPELKETDDERIRKWIRKELESKYVTDNIVNNVMADKALAWLEKQGEQNPVVTPKFRIGDIITPKGKKEYYTIIGIVDGWYEFREKHINGGIPIHYQFGWELVEQKPVEWSANDLPEFESYLCLMFQKFRTKGVCTNGEIIDFVKEYSQKLKDTLCHTWSEEDEKAINDIMWIIEAYRENSFNEIHKQMANNAERWLKFLKDRVQPKQEWSEEDDYNLQCMIAKVSSDIQKGNVGRNNELIDWLKSLKDRVLPQPKQEWSEEDEGKLKDCIVAIQEATYFENDYKDELVNLIKSLRPQSQWKPSDEQMKSLRWVIEYGNTTQTETLKCIYEQLKKLREE